MDRFMAVLLLFGLLLSALLIFLAFFAISPIFCSCVVTLLYSLYLYLFNESHEVHHAQEFENRFWTIFVLLLSTAAFFAKDSPLAFGQWNPSLGFLGVLICGYSIHLWDRHLHRKRLTRSVRIKRDVTAVQSLVRLHHLGVQEQLSRVKSCLNDIDQVLIPSTINNILNQRYILSKEKEIISIFEDATDPKALNYLISHSELPRLFYKIKDHRSFNHRHRTQLIELLTVERLSQLNVHSKVLVLHSLQIMKLKANIKAEYWVKNIILSTKQDSLSELKTLMDCKGDNYSMHHLIFEDITLENIRTEILTYIRKQAQVQRSHMQFNTKHSKIRKQNAWRKILSDVDDTLYCSGGSYPAGIDKRFAKRQLYPGALGFYRELDLGTDGPEEWSTLKPGNLVFLSARPHIYKNITEMQNLEKFEKLHSRAGDDGRGGMHTSPSLLAGDLQSGIECIVKNDFEPLAQKKFQNFKRYVSIYPEFSHVFVCDNGQGDVRAAKLMVTEFPQQVEAIYVHRVQPISKTFGYKGTEWRNMENRPFFFTTYPEAALHAATRKPPIIRAKGLRRICQDAVHDFHMIQTTNWPSQKHKWDRRDELNQALWLCNKYLKSCNEDPVDLLYTERIWKEGEKVRTPYGIGKVVSFDPVFDLYHIDLDWRGMDIQIAEDKAMKQIINSKGGDESKNVASSVISEVTSESSPVPLETVLETVEEVDEDHFPRSPIPSYDQIEIVNSSPQKEVSGASSKPTMNTKNTTQDDPPPLCPEEDSIIEDTLLLGKTKKSSTDCSTVRAIVQGRFVSRYTPPTVFLPKEGRSSFSFNVTKPEPQKVKPKQLLNTGDKCNTPFGAGKVIEYREKKGVVVVKLTGWTAIAYLDENIVKPGSDGLFGSLLKIITTSDTEKAKQPKPPEVIFEKNTLLITPFGDGKVVSTVTKKDNKLTIEANKVDNEEKNTVPATKSGLNPETIGITLTTWVLANGHNATLYCTIDTAMRWKKTEANRKSTGLFSVFGSIVSQSFNLFKSQPEKKVVDNIPSIILVPRFERFFHDGAAVTTPFGDGMVVSFRNIDGFYEINLLQWKLANNKFAKAFMRNDSLGYRVAKGCREGYPVFYSKLCVSGTLASIQQTTGVHVVTMPSTGMVCYLQPDGLEPLKAAVGEDVLTPYGEGKVRKYRSHDQMYEIDLQTGMKLFAKGESFDRANDCLEDKQIQGINWWLFRYFSSDNTNNAKDGGGSQRSRSNSIASLSARSQTSKSIK